MPPEAVRVAVLGAGYWAKALARAIQRSSRLALVGNYSPNGERRRAFAQSFACTEYPDYEAILADPRVEAVILATPNQLHAPQVIAAARAAKHVYVEKPLANSAADARAAVEAAEEAGTVLAVGHEMRRFPLHRRMRELLGAGGIGEPLLLAGDYSLAGGLNLAPGSWKGRREECPGGPLTQLGVHHLDTYLYLAGPIARVKAFLNRRVAGGESPDLASLSLEFQSGALGSLVGSYVSSRVYAMTVHGTEGTLAGSLDMSHWPDMTKTAQGSRLLLYERGGAAREVALATRDPLVENLEEFAACIREGGTPEVGGREALAVVRCVDAALASAAQDGGVAVA